MFCRTKKVKRMVKKLVDRIEKLEKEVEEAKKEPTLSYGESVVPVWLGMFRYYEQEKVPITKVLTQILAHLGMELVKKHEQPAQILLEKKPKVKKTS